MSSEMEAAAHAQLAFHQNSSAHESHKPGRNGQTQSRAAISAAHGSVSLCKSLKDSSLLFGSNSDTRIYDRKMEFDVVIRPRICLDVNNHFALLRELDVVADPIYNVLSQPARISHECARNLGLNVISKFQPLLMGAETERFHGVANDVAKIEVNRFDFQLAGFDLGIIQDVID